LTFWCDQIPELLLSWQHYSTTDNTLKINKIITKPLAICTENILQGGKEYILSKSDESRDGV
jgi:hypothetical protein